MRVAMSVPATRQQRPIRAAQYLRMSTEHQRYSLPNQKAAIGEYAAERNIEVVRSYIDAGKSGLTLKRRKALQQLIADVVAGKADYDAILVLDISRWGRFQDHDESAHYEFLCRAAGVKLHYCAEPFENDGSSISSLLKQLKRVMAGEYSRELSAKISRAQLHQARLGFKQGGSMQYGVRRLLIDEHGAPRFVLKPGQRKGLSTDRVIYIAGPDEEQEVIRRIFRMYVNDRMSLPAIARVLNEEGVLGAEGKPWLHGRLRWLMTNELVLGYYVYNKTTRKLDTPNQPNPPEKWVRTRVMEPIVSRKLFEAAARQLASNRGYGYSDKDLLTALRRLKRTGVPLCAAALDACPYTASARTYQLHFGTLERTFELIGYKKPGYTWRRPRRYYSDEELIGGLRRLREAHGYLSSALINRDPDMASTNYYKKRFGSVLKAYEAAGLTATRAQLISQARARTRAIFTEERLANPRMALAQAGPVSGSAN